MLHVTKKPYNSVLIQADSQHELGRTFIRFQEHYESANPSFKDGVFTIGQLRHWYSVKYGANTYERDWKGFNFPSRVLKPFLCGLFDPLTEEEQNLIELLKYRSDNFYVIGAQDDAILRHELAHALYNFSEEYAKKINSILDENKTTMRKTRNYIIEKGYHPDVLNDELQAYITDNDDEFIIENTPSSIIESINTLYHKYNKNEQ